MAFWSRSTSSHDRIRPRDLADFGRYEFVGAEQSGIDASAAYALVSSLNELVFTQDAAARAAVVDELGRHAAHGEWERVGAWKYVREFLTEDDDTRGLVDQGLLAVHRMRVTNLAVHLAPIDAPRYAQLTGAAPANDGFFGPPVFDSPFGPTRDHYFDHAVATAAARAVTRVPSFRGPVRGDVTAAARAMWDFGLLVHRGPLVVNPDIRVESDVVRPAVEAAHGTDHALFVNQLADLVLDDEIARGVWSALGGARFAEDYLDPAAMAAPGYARMLDAGLGWALRGGLLGVAMTERILTPRQAARLHTLRGTRP